MTYQISAAFTDHAKDAEPVDNDSAAIGETVDAKLQRYSDQLREAMQTSHSRLEAFQEIAANYPDTREKIAPLFEQKKAQSEARCQKLKAYAEVL